MKQVVTWIKRLIILIPLSTLNIHADPCSIWTPCKQSGQESGQFIPPKHLHVESLKIPQVIIDDGATNDDLAKKVAAIFHRDTGSFTLELSEGYILEGEE